MKLRTKLLWGAGPILLIIFLLFYLAASRIVLQGFTNIEISQARLDSNRAAQFIEQRAAQLLTSAADWGTWTPSYEFVQGEHEPFASNNLIPASLTALKIDAMLFQNNDREIVWAGILNDDKSAIVSAPDDLVVLASESEFFAPGRVEGTGVSGLVRLDGGLMIVAAHSLLNSEGEGPSQGVILLGQYLTKDMVETIAAELRMHIYLQEYGEPTPHETPPAARIAMQHGADFFWKIESANEACVYRALLDISGQPVAEMHIHLPRESYQQGLRTLRLFALILLGSGILFTLILFIMQRHLVLTPMLDLDKQIEAAGIASDTPPRVALPGAPDEFVALSAHVTDTLQREWRAHQAVRESQRQYEILFTSMLTGFAVHEMIYDESGRAVDYRFLSANPAFERITGLPIKKILGRTLKEALPEAEPFWIETYARVAETGEAASFEAHSRPLGKTFEVNAFRPAPGQFATLVNDITPRKETETLLHLQSAALESAANAIVITDAKGIIQWVNTAFTQITGYTREEAIGQPPGHLVASGQQDAAFYKHFWDVITSGSVWHGEIVNRRKDGRLYTEEMSVTPVINEKGVVTHYIAIESDITEHKQLQAQLLQVQRLESVGRLASGLAHDINNILTPILMAPPILREAISDPAALSIVDSVETSAQRGADIIKQLLAFGRGASDKRVPVSLRALAKEMLTLMEGTFPKNILIRTRLPTDTALVHGDPTQLHQVLMNLCVNARDAMPDGGTLTLAIQRTEVTHTIAQNQPGIAPGTFVLFTVTDTGIGIKHEILEKIFDPFFTTKPTGEGTGLGLAVLLSIVRGHKGFVQVQSEPNHGSSFHVYLPALDTPAPIHSDPPKIALPQGNGETILLVDDEEQIRILASKILARNGYTIQHAATAHAALNILREHRATLRAIITDITMPGMDGLELIRIIRESERDLPIIAISGNTPTPAQLEDLTSLTQHFLTKPFTAAEILSILHSVIHPS